MWRTRYLFFIIFSYITHLFNRRWVLTFQQKLGFKGKLRVQQLRAKLYRENVLRVCFIFFMGAIPGSWGVYEQLIPFILLHLAFLWPFSTWVIAYLLSTSPFLLISKIIQLSCQEINISLGSFCFKAYWHIGWAIHDGGLLSWLCGISGTVSFSISTFTKFIKFVAACLICPR